MLRSPSFHVLALLCGGSAAAQSIVHVDASAQPGGDGTSWSTAFVDLQDGLVAAASLGAPVEVWVAEGSYRPDRGTGDRAAAFVLFDGLSLYGGFAGDEGSPAERDIAAHPTVLTGDLAGDDGPDFANYGENSQHVVRCSLATGAKLLDGFRVEHGNSAGSPDFAKRGAGALFYRSNALVRGSTFEANLGGGASFFDNCSYQLVDCSFLQNRAAGAAGLMSFWSSASLSGCRFEGNAVTDPTEDAGGMRHVGIKASHAAHLTGCSFVGNTALSRGGALMLVMTPNGETIRSSLTDCTFEGNAALSGGAVFSLGQSNLNVEYEQLTVRRCRFTGNRAPSSGAGIKPGYGGALFSYHTGLELADSDFTGNQALAAGALHEERGRWVYVWNCRFVDNAALSWQSGAVRIETSQSWLVNCTFVANRAVEDGGAFSIGLFDPSHDPVVAHCTVVGNDGGAGSAAYFAGFQPRLSNSIVWGNSSAHGTGQNAQLSGAPTVDHCCVQGWDGSFPGVGSFGADPGFANAAGCDGALGDADDDLRLDLGSPCIDAGAAAYLPADLADVDLDGNTSEPTPLDLDRLPRSDGAAPDLGAYETQAAIATPAAYCTAKTNSAGCAPRMCWWGRPSLSGVDEFTLTATEVLNQKHGLLIWSFAPDALPFGGGTLCVQAPVLRAPVLGSGGGASGSDCSGVFVRRFERDYMLAVGAGAGDFVYAQFWARDPGFASPGNVQLSDAVAFQIAP